MIQTINPATGKPLQEYEIMSQEEALIVAEKSQATFGEWKKSSIAERGIALAKLAVLLRKNNQEYAELMTNEMGKPITESLAEVEKCAWLIDVLLEKAEAWLADEEIAANGKKHLVTYEPLGTIYMIMPWNYPFWQVFKVGMPHLMAGNTLLLKHARNVTGCALAIGQACADAGVPLRTVLIDHATSDALIDSNDVQAVSLTGSVSAGMNIAARAGKRIKKTVLELGGSDPFIVLDDANVEAAATGAVLGRASNGGQVCIGAKRMIVHEKVAEAFTKLFSEKMNALVIGDPLDPKTQVGPLVDEKAVLDMEAFVKDAVEKGATILTGGKRVPREGFFFEPTVLSSIAPDMNVTRQEVFGPIAPIIIVKTDDEAIIIANNSEFGLNASVWTKDLARGERLARRIDSGGVFINHISVSNPLLPLGGIKHSGYGRELSHLGIKEFTNAKGINIYEEL